MRTKTPDFHDHRRAEEALAARDALCAARGCPRPWSVHVGKSTLCSRHAGHPPEEWPAITESILWEDAERARELAQAPAPERRDLLRGYRVKADPAQIAALRETREAIAQASAELPAVRRRWLALRERERTGQRLTPYQASAWRVGLRLPLEAGAHDLAWFERQGE